MRDYSLCRRKGSLLWFVPRDALKLTTPEANSKAYTFNQHVTRHHFCPVCGIHPYGEGADPKGERMVAINIRSSIALTGFLGTESAALSNLFSGPAFVWQLAAALTQPIWGAGRVDAQVEDATARQKEALANYEKAVQKSFADVRIALAAHQAARETAEAQTRRSEALAQAYKLARLRYDNGISSLLDVLDAERNLLGAELSRLDALTTQRTAVADLIKALGGGWAVAQN